MCYYSILNEHEKNECQPARKHLLIFSSIIIKKNKRILSYLHIDDIVGSDK